MEYVELSKKLKNKYTIDLVDISYYFNQGKDWLTKELQKYKRESFENNYRLVLTYSQDLYEYVDMPPVLCYDLYKTIYELDISEFFVILITEQDLTNELKQAKQLLNNNKTNFYTVDTQVDLEYYIAKNINSAVVPNVQENKNTSCRKLWDHLHINTNGDVLPCCVSDHNQSFGNITEQSINEILNSDKRKYFQDAMLNNKKLSACRKCYEDEKNDIKSFRQPIDTDVNHIDVTTFDIRLSNLCNLKCRMCTGQYSSRIAKEEKDLYGAEYKTVDVDNIIDIDSLLDLIKNAERIYFAGGEPLLMKSHYMILDELVRLNKFDTRLDYNTNLTTLRYKNLNVLDYWKKFSTVEIGASIDACDKHLEYIREGTVWKDVISNYNELKTTDCKFEITANINIYNAFNLIDNQKIWIRKSVPLPNFKITILTHPEYLSIQVLPTEYKIQLINKIQSHINELKSQLNSDSLVDQWNSVIDHLNSGDKSHLLPKFFKETQRLDQIRGTNFDEVFTEYADLKSYL